MNPDIRYCRKCGRKACIPCVPQDQKPARYFVVVATDKQLLRRSYFHRLAMATKALSMPRREIPNWIADTLFNFNGRIIWPNGHPFEISDTAIDDAFFNDGSFRWLSDFMGFADEAPRQAPQRRLLARLRLIDLAFRIAYPDRASLIAK